MQAFPTWRRAGAWVVAASVAAALAACGGGDGDAGSQPSPAPLGPPTSAATIAVSTTDAVTTAQTAVTAADSMVANQGPLAALTTVLAGPTTATAPATPSALSGAPGGLKRAQAVTTEPCGQVLNAPCSGTVTVDTNIPDNTSNVTAGQYIDATFNALSGFSGGAAVSFGGRLRVEFLTGFNLNQTSLAGLGMRMAFNGFAGSYNGAAFGPFAQTMDLVFDAQQVPSLTTNGARYGSLANVSITGSGDYLVSSGNARVAYGSASAGYVDVTYGNWRNTSGRPVSGTATLTAASTTVTVASTTETQVVYNVVINNNQAPAAQYQVTATYPVGGGVPTYAVTGL